jgi:hypothetical protein
MNGYALIMPSIQVFNIELASAITENPYLEYLDLS